MKSQIIRHDIKANLEIALEYSHTGLKADDQGDYEAAVTAYQKVILTLTDVLFDYNKDIRKTNSLDSKKKRRLIKEKRDKYINRLNVLWESIPYHCKVSLSTLLCRPGQTSANRTHHFVDYQTSLTNVLQIDSRKEVIPVYSSDSYISTFEKLGRISQTIRHGSYVDDSLFVPPDVWSCGWQKIDSIEIKQTAIQLLTTPLAKLTSIQQSDAHLSNLLKFKQALSEFLNSQEQAANFLTKSSDEQTSSKVTNWVKPRNLFKPQKQATIQYRSLLVQFLDQSVSVFLFWLNKTVGPTKHESHEVIRSSLEKVVQFYDSVILKMCQHDLEDQIHRFLKKMKKAIYEDLK